MQVSSPSLHGSQVDLATLSDILANENKRIISQVNSGRNSPVPPIIAKEETPAVASTEAKASGEIETPTTSSALTVAATNHSNLLLSAMLVMAGFAVGRLSTMRG